MNQPTFEVLLTQGAEQDLEAIYDYIALTDLPVNANYVLDGLLAEIENLVQFPERGSYPKELIALGIQEYRQCFFKPYRDIYRIQSQTIFIVLIADGRRDMQFLLTRRLLNA